MKLLFKYLTHSMKESETVVKSPRLTPKKTNGCQGKASKGNGNTKNSKNTKASTSGTDIKLTKFFNSLKVNRSPKLEEQSSNDDDGIGANDRKQNCNSQSNGTPKKRPYNKSSSKSSPLKKTKKSTPSKRAANTTPKKRTTTSLSTSASASAKKRAIERALKKKEPTGIGAKRKLKKLDSPELKKFKRKYKKKKQEPSVSGGSGDDNEEEVDVVGGVEDVVTPRKRKKASSKSPKNKRSRKRLDSNKSDDSERPRPRRKASQTYFIKYQLARNPLKAEEEDLKQALLASLEQCGQHKTTSSKKQQQLLNELLLQEQNINLSTSSKTSSKQQQNQQQQHNQRENHLQHQKQPRKQHPKRPPNNKHSKTSSLSITQNMVPVTLASVATSTPPRYDEEYLEKYRPDTEDFLTFICFRVTAPKLPNGYEQQTLSTNSSSMEQTNQDIETTANVNGNSTSINNHRSGLTNGFNHSSSITGSLKIKIEPNGNNIHNTNNSSSNSNLSAFDEQHHHQPNLRRSVSPYKTENNNISNPVSSSSIASNQQQLIHSPISNRRRPPTRQSPRLANCNSANQQQKISEQIPDCRISVKNNTATIATQVIDYEEDLKRASIALEDMAQEVINYNEHNTGSSPYSTASSTTSTLSSSSSSTSLLTTTTSVTTRQQNGKQSTYPNQNLLLSTADAIERQQNSTNQNQANISSNGPTNTTASPTATSITASSSSNNQQSNSRNKSNQATSTNGTTLPFKNQKLHLVRGLMTREFAGTFADEEIIFESISNHKL